jgi:hypothetical protein
LTRLKAGLQLKSADARGNPSRLRRIFNHFSAPARTATGYKRATRRSLVARAGRSFPLRDPWSFSMRTLLVLALVAVGGSLAFVPDARSEDKKGDAKIDGWTSAFVVEKDELTHTGKNPFFILEPGYVSVFEDGKEQLTITVLSETKTVDGVECRVVEERETKNGKLVEVSRNYFAISKRTNCVYYFGEDVDMYKDGKVVSHDGAWLSGKDGAKFGLMMPGQPLLKAQYYQEVAPKIAMDRAEIVSLTETVKTPAGEFKDCLKVEETTPLEPGVKEYKCYARGIGLIRDGDLTLVKYGKPDKPK